MGLEKKFTDLQWGRQEVSFLHFSSHLDFWYFCVALCWCGLLYAQTITLSICCCWRRDVFQLVREYIIGKHQFYRGKQLLSYMIRERTFLVFTTTKIIPTTNTLSLFSCVHSSWSLLIHSLVFMHFPVRNSTLLVLLSESFRYFFSNRKYLRNTQYSMMIDDNSFEI